MLGLIEYNSTEHIVAAGIMHADWFIQSSLEVRSIYSNRLTMNADWFIQSNLLVRVIYSNMTMNADWLFNRFSR